MPVKKVTASLLRRVEDFIMPPLCVVCDRALAGDRWLCPACLGSLAANHGSRDACPRCSTNRQRHECACEFAWDFPFDRAFAAYDYDDVLRSIARHIKYDGKMRLARRMGTIIAGITPKDFFDGADIIIPVPLHKARKRRRGYNQAEAIARGLSDSLRPAGRKDGGSDGEDMGKAGGYPNLTLRTDLLARVKNTGTQTKLDKDERMKNLSGAFAVNPDKAGGLKGKVVILVDDILTTGATVESCSEILLAAGCQSVRVLSMGRG